MKSSTSTHVKFNLPGMDGVTDWIPPRLGSGTAIQYQKKTQTTTTMIIVHTHTYTHKKKRRYQ